MRTSSRSGTGTCAQNGRPSERGAGAYTVRETRYGSCDNAGKAHHTLIDRSEEGLDSIWPTPCIDDCEAFLSETRMPTSWTRESASFDHAAYITRGTHAPPLGWAV